MTPRLLRVRLEMIEVLMLRGFVKRKLTLAGIWEHIEIRQDSWSCSGQGASWEILPNEASFEAVRRLCEVELAGDPALGFYLARYISRHPATHQIPAEVRAEAARWAGSERCARKPGR
jgi:hypothetical protein